MIIDAFITIFKEIKRKRRDKERLDTDVVKAISEQMQKGNVTFVNTPLSEEPILFDEKTGKILMR